MKNTLIAAFCSLVLLLSACEPAVTFKEPQPADTKNLNEIPRRLRGSYLCQSDSSILYISDKLMFQQYEGVEWSHESALGNEYRESGDTVTHIASGRSILAERAGDSLWIPVQWNDTLFSMSFDNVLRKYQGRYFINTRYDKESWGVYMLELTRGTLEVRSISTENDWKSLKEITETAQDTVPVAVTATAKQFKEFVGSGGFSDNEKYIRLRR